MKIGSILNRYIFMEMIPPFVISIFFFIFILFISRILVIANLIVNYNINITSVLLLLLYSVPRFLELVIPISIMITVLLTCLRLAGDNEIVALKAGGISLYSLLPPVILFAAAGCLLTGFMTVYGVPRGRLALKDLTFKMAANHLDVSLKEQTFNDSFKGFMLYINKIDIKNKLLIDVYIEDQRDKDTLCTIIAPRGELFKNPEQLSIHLRLYNGVINRVDIDKRAVNSINFNTYDINLDFAKAVSTAMEREKNEEEMSLGELYGYLKNTAKESPDYYEALIEFHKKFSIPFACFAFGLIAIPVGVRGGSRKRIFGLGFGLFVILFYYILLSAAFVFGETGAYPPLLGLWVPNIVIGGIGAYLLVRVTNDAPLSIKFFSRFK